MLRQFTRAESALIEFLMLASPALPAWLWLFPAISDTRLERLANALIYVYWIAGILFIGLRRWRWHEIGVNRHGIGFSLACGAVLIAARFFALACTNLPLTWQYNSLAQFIGDLFFYFALVGVGEELVFRGVLYRALVEWRGTRWAIWVTSFAFGLWHLSGRGIAGIAIGIFYGIFFAAMRWRAGGIVGLIIAHALIDLSVVALAPSVDVNYLLTQVQVVNSGLAILSELTFIALLVYLWKAPRRQIYV